MGVINIIVLIVLLTFFNRTVGEDVEYARKPERRSCDPPCQNNGACLPSHICECPVNFKGKSCQFEKSNCNPRKMPFNGVPNCKETIDTLICSISCPTGTTFEFPPDKTYNCSYETGKFTPSKIPQCIGDFALRFYSAGKYVSSQHNNNSISNRIDFEELLRANDGDKKKYGFCYVWGATHFRTFDEKIYSFSSCWAYVLVQAQNKFKVVIQNDKECTGNLIKCSKIIQIHIKREKYTLKTVNGKLCISSSFAISNYPYYSKDIKVEKEGFNYIIYIINADFNIKWDGKTVVQVVMPSSFCGSTEGLCGNFDNNPANDFMTPWREFRDDVVAFSSSWKHRDIEKCTTQPSTTDTTTCSGDAEKYCKELFEKRYFDPCRSLIKPTDFMESCKWDACVVKDANYENEFICPLHNVMVRECLAKGVNLTSWKTDTFCPSKCKGNKVYFPCGPPNGEEMCGGLHCKPIDDTSCNEGCYCPEDMVLHDDVCIKKSDCPCLSKGIEYPSGKEINQGCNKCTCIDGKWECSDQGCEVKCRIRGDPHYTSIDGKSYDFMGKCSYYLLKIISQPYFWIEVESAACYLDEFDVEESEKESLPSCTKSVTIVYEKQKIVLKQKKEVTVNGEDVTKLPCQLYFAEIKKISSKYVQVDLINEILVTWDGEVGVQVMIPPKYKNETMGLCGTFTDNQNDDFLTPSGDIEANANIFGSKWKTDETCDDHTGNHSTTDPCDKYPEKRNYTYEKCEIFQGDVFKECHNRVDPKVIYSMCLYDLCSCDMQPSQCFCPIVSSYVCDCAENGIFVDWMTKVPECRTKCPSGQTYQVCADQCTTSCAEISKHPNCEMRCVEGCNCPKGETLDKYDTCIPISHCPCVYEGISFEAGFVGLVVNETSEKCSCINALWHCEPVNPGDFPDLPILNNATNICDASENKEFSRCKTQSPATCNQPEPSSLVKPGQCEAGCVCKKGFVLDVNTGKCILLDQCPCYHGGKSFKDGEKFKKECHECTCDNRNWKCEEIPCSPHCIAYGHHHFITFDGRTYDFYGNCEYVLASGTLDGAKFRVAIDIEKCSFADSCFQGVTVFIDKNDKPEKVLFRRAEISSRFDEHQSFQDLFIAKVGLFRTVELVDFGVVVYWDEQSTVKIKLEQRWKSQVAGLCGNFNGDQNDDFITPAGGFPEVSAVVFGHSWKLQESCPNPTEPDQVQNPCGKNENLKEWASENCKVLKSSVFTSCHQDVLVEEYYKKCIIDVCLSKIPGHKEICVILAAYAQECNKNGINIVWRNQHLCPMQCDKPCISYSSCISTCPIETCENTKYLKEHASTCANDICIEGCLIEQCPAGKIFANSQMLECVPTDQCNNIS